MAASGLGEACSGNGAASDTTKSKLQDGKSPLASGVGGCVKDGFHGHSATHRAARGPRLVLCGDLWEGNAKRGAAWHMQSCISLLCRTSQHNVAKRLDSNKDKHPSSYSGNNGKTERLCPQVPCCTHDPVCLTKACRSFSWPRGHS